MKNTLYYTPTSPFVRKVRVAAAELGLEQSLQLELLRPTPTAPDAALSVVNPLSKIPALTTADGLALYDSRVIVEWLDAHRPANRAPLVPASGPQRWQTLRTQALCDGILDAGILVFYERLQRPAELHWQPWLDGQAAKVQQGLDALEKECVLFGESVDLGQICAGVTLGWLAFRNPVGSPTAERPRLAAWWQDFSKRLSMLETLPL